MGDEDSSPMTFKDHFSKNSDRYGAFRPSYPEPLFELLASLALGHDLAWDCATGNGQAAHGLVPHFRSVVATDASAAQVAQARPHDRIAYHVAPAEQSPIPDGTVDLVTVAQALHWLDHDRFYAEVRRVCHPDAVLACWCYSGVSITPPIDAVVGHFYAEIVGSYWPPERSLVEAGYRTLPFPFDEFTPPSFEMVQHWDLERLVGYLGTWSSSQRYRSDRGSDPLDEIRDGLREAWGDPAMERRVRFPLHLRIGRVPEGG